MIITHVRSLGELTSISVLQWTDEEILAALRKGYEIHRIPKGPRWPHSHIAENVRTAAKGRNLI